MHVVCMFADSPRFRQRFFSEIEIFFFFFESSCNPLMFLDSISAS